MPCRAGCPRRAHGARGDNWASAYRYLAKLTYVTIAPRTHSYFGAGEGDRERVRVIARRDVIAFSAIRGPRERISR